MAVEKQRIDQSGLNMSKFIPLLISVSLIICLVGCSSDKNDSTSRREGMPADANNGPTFSVYDTFGKPHTFEEFKGKGPIVLNFWGTWCPPCRRELPDLKKIYAEYQPQGLEMIGLAVNDSPGKVRQFSAENGMNWIMLLADDNAIQSFQLGSGIPVTIFINREGKEVSRLIGARGYDDFKREISKIL